eukprot:1560205-Rhodomonas_salina.1
MVRSAYACAMQRPVLTYSMALPGEENEGGGRETQGRWRSAHGEIKHKKTQTQDNLYFLVLDSGVYGSFGLRVCYAACGTELAYGATRVLRVCYACATRCAVLSWRMGLPGGDQHQRRFARPRQRHLSA